MTETTRTRWGGIVAERVRASGYFRVEQIDGVWWFVDPDGGLFLSKGVDAVNFDHDCIQNTNRFPYREACQQKYGSRDAWRAAAAERLRSWGFNSLGTWSDDKVANAGSAPLAVTAIVDIAGSYCSQQLGWPSGDAFHPDFEIFARKRASDVCGPHRSDAGFIGWFTDNELRWAPVQASGRFRIRLNSMAGLGLIQDHPQTHCRASANYVCAPSSCGRAAPAAAAGFAPSAA